MRTSIGLGLALVAALLFAGNASATYSLGVDKTIYDQELNSTAGGGFTTPADFRQEDNETERRLNVDGSSNYTNTYDTDEYDLEGMFLKGKDGDPQVLQLVGTFDFQNGGGNTWYAGDLFLSNSGGANFGYDRGTQGLSGDSADAVLSRAANPLASVYEFEYVVHFNWIDNSTHKTAGSVGYEIYQIYDPFAGTPINETLVNPNTGQLPDSGPYRYTAGNNQVGSGTATLIHDTLTGDPLSTESGAAGSSHYVVELDWLNVLSAIGGYDSNNVVTVHFTMLCGNDAMAASISKPKTPVPVPEPASMALLGMGILCVAMRKRFIA